MLAIAAVKNLHQAAADSAGLSVNRIARATYQTQSHGRSMHGRGKWVSRLLAYLQGGLGAVKHSSLANAFSNTAAARLRVISARAASATRTAARGGFMRSASQRITSLLYSAPVSSRFAGRSAGAGQWAFAKGGKWSPYVNIFTHSLRTLSSRSRATSAQVIMAQIRRQAVMGCMTQQRKGLAIALPHTRDVQFETLVSVAGRTEETAAAKLAAGGTKMPAARSKGTSSSGSQLHPATTAAQESAVPFDQCVIISIPYGPPSVTSLLSGNGQASLADVTHVLSSQQQAQNRHTLLLTRLIERLSATGWELQYRQTTHGTGCIEIAIPPSSGVTTASELDALLCTWGFDTALIAAVICDPRASPANQPPSPHAAANGVELSGTMSSELDDLDSRMFSLIVDEI
ncbi:hypothetical protein H4S02_009643, partial [Coemansia sp. RSA 2611]